MVRRRATFLSLLLGCGALNAPSSAGRRLKTRRPTSTIDPPSIKTLDDAPAAVVAPADGLDCEIEILGETLDIELHRSGDACGEEDIEPVVEMDILKEIVDTSEGLAGLTGGAIGAVFGDTVRRRLWTKADYAHIHAVSGAYFLGVGFLWLLTSHALMAADPASVQSWHLDKPLESSIVVMGAVNAVSAVPMARFSSNKMLDMSDLKANGFTFGGAGLTLMSCWMAWWFSGGYPDVLRPVGPGFLALWSAVCAGTTLNWEVMLQQNFESQKKGKAGQGKFKKVSQEELNEKAILYRLASWPNLTQLLFLYSISLPDASEWWSRTLESYPLQGVMLYHYGFASALGYALSMFSETLRDRKLVSLRVDLIVLIVGVFLPMVSVGVDGFLLGDQVTVNPLNYWRQFQGW